MANISKNPQFYSKKWPTKTATKSWRFLLRFGFLLSQCLCRILLVSPYFLLFHDILEPQNSPLNEVTSTNIYANSLLKYAERGRGQNFPIFISCRYLVELGPRQLGLPVADQRKLFLDRVFQEPFGSWTSAPKIVDVRTKKCILLRPR